MASRKGAKARRSSGSAKGRTARKPGRKKVEAIPRLSGCLIPGLALRGAAEAIAFYEKAFGAKELSRMTGPDGKIMHAELKLGDRVLFVGDEAPEMGAPSPLALGGSPVSLMHYVKDVDAVFARAVAAGAKSVMPPADMFWGDRFGSLVDPWGHRWALATHKADLTPKQMKKAMDEWLASQAPLPG
ncbi:MAG: VOC family protein [Anaeromyxobacteraceae bacterium]